MPDHSTFSKNRHGRFRASEAFRYVFDTVVRRCMAAGLVEGEGFAVDASVVKADANRQRGVPGTTTVDWANPQRSNRAVREYLAALDAVELAEGMPKNISVIPVRRHCEEAGDQWPSTRHCSSRISRSRYTSVSGSAPAS